jgi:hypothetical protein
MRARGRVVLVVCGMLAAMFARLSAAESRPGPALEISTGWAGFVDNATIHHGVVGGAGRFYVTPRVSVGPELTYMIGPRNDRDLILTGNLTFDFRKPRPGRPLRFTPYLVAGGGLFHHSARFSGRSFATNEGAFTGGGGARFFVTDSLYIAPEARLGWELHQRLTVTVGWQLR